MPRFAILNHDRPFLHWDFLLESGDVLRAWRLLAEPARGRTIDAGPLPDHRLVYLNYEGPIGGERGRVSRWDGGTFVWQRDAADEIQIGLAGGRIEGVVLLRRYGDRWRWEWTQ